MIQSGDVGEFLVELPAELPAAVDAPVIAWTCALEGGADGELCPFAGMLREQDGRAPPKKLVVAFFSGFFGNFPQFVFQFNIVCIVRR